MQILRRGAVVLLVPLLSLFLFAFAINLGVVKIITHPDTIKKILNDSGIYSSLVGNILDQSKNITSGNTNVPLTNPSVRAAANKAIPSDFIKSNTESFIDSIYSWLDGKTPTPDFSINVAPVKTQFADNVASDLTQRLSELPPCTPGTSFTGFDAFNATCVPRGVTTDQAVATVKQNILNGQGFLDESTLNASSLKSSNGSQSVFNDQLKDAPNTFQKAKRSPLILGVLVILIATGIILLSSTKRLGFRKVGLTMLSIGVLILVVAWALSHATDKIINKIDLKGQVTQENVKMVVKDVVQEVDRLYWITGAVYAVVGGSILVGSKFLFRNGGSSAFSKSEVEAEPGDHKEIGPEVQHHRVEPEKTESVKASPTGPKRIEIK